jgi:hypothetical protein
MAFRFPLGQGGQERIKRELQEAIACNDASDEVLARLLLSLATVVRDELPARFQWREPGDGYDGAFVWEIIPEIARRLGIEDASRQARPYALREVNESDLRSYAAYAILNAHPHLPGASAAALEAWRKLLREPANGNVVAIALDRIAAPAPDAQDPLALRLREVSVVRGFAETAIWRPELNGEPVVAALSP